MTIANTSNKNEYTGNGSIVAFDYIYPIDDASHMAVYLDGVLLGSGYSVSGVGAPGGGTVTLNTPPASGVVVTLLREVPLTQQTDYAAYDAFPEETHEAALDKLTKITQQLTEKGSRQLSRAPGRPDWDAQGRRITNVADAVDNQDAATLANAESKKQEAIAYITSLLNNYSSSDLAFAALAATDSTVLVGGKEAGKLAAGVKYLTPEMFFIAGEVDATGMIRRMAEAITDGTRCEFQAAEYVISYAGLGVAAFNKPPYGEAVIDISGFKNVSIKGNNTVIKCVNHDIAANGGFLFFRGAAMKSPRISGFTFDMTFTGTNTSSLYYPFVGAIIFFDTATGIHTQDELCQDVKVSDCNFKLYHPFGGFATSPNAYSGDPNNGYKLYSILIYGDNLATTKATQNNKASIDDCTCLTGHNGYGFWVWSYNNVQFNNPVAEDWVFRYSDQNGNFIDGNIPFVRYHQFYNKGVQVNNIQFTGKPSGERAGAFAGSARAIGFNTNLSGAGLSGGDMIVNGGTITGGNGDAANSQGDELIFCNAYGRLMVGGGLLVDGLADATNASSGTFLQYSAEASGGTGYGEVHIGDVSLGQNMSYYNSLTILNGAAAAGDRRCKILTIKATTSASQFQYFLDTDGGSAATARGVADVRINDVLIDGTNNTVFGPASTNSRAFRLSGTASDSITGNSVIVKGKYYEFLTSSLDAAATFQIDNYKAINTTTRMIGSKLPVLGLTISGTPEGNQVAAVGSTAKRTDGGAATTFYVKESGTGNTGWAAK